MADYGVNIKVGVQGQNNAKQLGEQIREIVRGLEAADSAFTRFTNNLKSFDQRRAQRKINEELDNTAQKYRELDRLQRQLLANDNSAIKTAEKRAKIEDHISKNISAGRIRRRARFLRGDPEQFPSGANQPFAPDPMVAIRKQRDAEAKFAREIFNIEQDFNRRINNTEIDLLQDKIKREMNAQQEIFNNAMRLNKKAADDFDKRLAQRTRAKNEATRLTGQTSPVGGAVGIPGSPAALAAVARAQRIKSAQGSALIGGAFPLLFGQGLGAAAGGAAGGFGGGMIGGEFGFGLSLVGTQIGALIDQLAAKAIDLGKALNPLTADTETIIAAVGKSNTEFASLVKELNAAGESAFALELASQELEKVVGTDGVEAFELFSARIVGLQNDVAVLTTKIGAFVAGLINTMTAETLTTKQVRERSAAVFEARQSKDPEIVAAVAALDALGPDPKARIAQQEKILDLLENGTKAQKEALRLRQLDVKLGKDQARLIDQSTNLTALNTELIALGEEKYTARGIALQQNIARQIKSNSIEKAYKDFAEDNLTLAGLRATIRGAEADFAREIATIDANAARHAAKSSKKADPTINLEKRLGIINSQIKAEQEIVGLNDKSAAIVRRKLAFEKRIAQIRETGKAERQKLTDLEDISLSKSIQENGVKLATLQFEREIAVALEQSTKASEKTLEPVQKKLNALKDRNAFEREYGELIMSGSTTAAAKQVIEAKKQVKEIDELVKKQILSNQIQINILRIIVAQAIGTDRHAEAQEALNDALEREKQIREEGEKAKGEVKGKKTPAENIEAEMKRIQGVLNDLVDPANQVIAAANAIGDAFSESFKGLITGSMSAQEALRNLFARTADHFADMAAQMIANAIKMKILGIALNAFGSAAGSFSQAPSAAAQTAGANAFSQPAVPFTLGFAEGGYVSSPTRALIGEGGEPEFVIPESKMRESMARYSRGARGSAVIPEAGASGTSGEGGGVAVAAPIDVRYTVERINSVDYVTADQFEQGMQQAATQGAKQGEQQTLKRLQMSGSTRRRLGM